MDCIFHGLGTDRDMSGSRVSVGFLFCCPAFVGILEKASETGACDFSVGSSDHGDDVCVYAVGKDSVWNPDFYRNGYAASDPAVKSVGTDSGMGGIRRKLPAFWTDKKCEQRSLWL